MMHSFPVVFFPGTQCDERLWLPLWREMNIHERRYVPLQWAETLEQMDGLSQHAVGEDKVHLVAFSMGGYLASRFALAHPQQVASLTLIGFCSTGLEERELKQRQLIINALEKGQFRPMSNERLSMMVHPHSPNRQMAEQTIREMEQDLGASVLKYHLMAASNRPDLTPALAKAPFPIHLIAAEQDQVAQLSKMQTMHQGIPQASLKLFADAGHMLPLEQPQRLAAELAEYLG